MHGNREGNKLLKMLEDTFLTQIVTEPTRENNLLDLVLVSDSGLTRECQVGEKLDGCDHHLIRLKIRTDHELTINPSKIPDNKRANFNLAQRTANSDHLGVHKPHSCGRHVDRLQEQAPRGRENNCSHED